MHSRRFLADLLALLGVLVLLLSGFMPAGAAPSAAPAAATAPEPQPAPEPAGWLNPSGEPAPVAETVSWTGAAGDGRWSTPANWSDGRLPGPADIARFAGSVLAIHQDQPTILGGLVLEAGLSGTLYLDAPLRVLGDVHMAGGTVEAGSAPIEILGVAEVQGGLLTTPAGAVMAVRSLHIEQPGIVRLGQEGKLELSGEGEPLTGNGVLDTTTNRPNSVEYTGRATADLTSAGPAAGLRAAVPEGLRRVGALELSLCEGGLHAAVIDRAAGFAYFGAGYDPALVVKVRLSDFTRVGVLAFNPYEMTIRSAVIDPAAGYAYFGTDNDDYPGKVVRVNLATFTRDEAITLYAGEVQLYAAVIDPAGDMAYFATQTWPGRIVRIRLSDFSRQGALILEEGENNPRSAVIDPAAGYSYWGTATNPGIVVKVRLSDFTRVGALPLNSGEDSLQAAVIDPAGGAAYFGTGTTPSRVVKVDLATFARAGALTLDADEPVVYAAVIDPAAGYAYFGTSGPSGVIGHVARVHLSDFTHDATVTFNAGEDAPYSAVIDPAAGYAYLGTANAPGIVVRVRLSDFTRDAALTLNAGERGFGNPVVDSAAGYAYFSATGPSGGRVGKIRLSDFTFVGAITLNADESLVSTAAPDLAAGYLYIGIWSEPGRVVKVDLATFTRVGGIDMNTGENELRAAVVDPVAGYLYLGCFGCHPGRVIKVRLSDFTRVGALDLPYNEYGLTAATIDPAAGYAYWATAYLPGRIVRVRLSDFSRDGSLVLNESDGQILSAAIDPVGGYSYWGTGTNQGNLVRVRLADFSHGGTLATGLGGYLWGIAIDSGGGYAYMGGHNSIPGIVGRVSLSDFTVTDALILEPDEFQVNSVAIDIVGGYAYFGVSTIPAHVIKVDIGGPSPTIAKTASPSTVQPGGPITYTLAFANVGSRPAFGVVLTDILPLSLTDVSIISSGAIITEIAGQRYVWEVQDLPSGAGGTITITGLLTGCFPSLLPVTNTATIALDGGIVRSSAAAVTGFNLAPLAADDAYSTDEDTALTVPAPGVLGNDTDGNCDVLVARVEVPPTHGMVQLAGDGSFLYTPAPNYSGGDSFTYVASDGEFTATATVNIAIAAVEDPPQTLNDTYTTTEDTLLTVPAPGVLGNDYDPEGAPLSAALLTPPVHGSLALAPDGSFSYTPAENWNGPDTFAYVASDGALTATAVALLNVGAIDDPPVAVDDAYGAHQDTPLVVAAPGVLGNDREVDGDPLAAFLLTPPQSGTLALAADGAFIYTPTIGWSGVDSFGYAASDGALTGTAQALITVTAVNHAPLAEGDAYTGTVDTLLAVPAPGVLGNDVDPEGDAMSTLLDIPPASGSLGLNADGSFLYVPAPAFSGLVTFTYQVSDGELTDTAMVRLSIVVNRAPVAVEDAYSTTVDAPLFVHTPGVLSNDYDQDGNPLTAVLDSEPATGTLALNDDGSFIYLPARGWSGAITLTYHAYDGMLLSPAAIVTIDVLPACQAVTQVTMTWAPPLPAVGQVVALAGEVQGSLPVTWNWSFDDGAMAEGQQVTHTFSLAGVHLITLTVENACSGPLAVTRQLMVAEGQVWKAYLPLIFETRVLGLEGAR